ncbi:MAG TPA: T9SS type A sorting domain-containing protein, partial [Chitinophagaceae bacterium]|nr:T9SS type A sorting domain-containing protein [Chitinophagaceae bacterium]
TLKRHYYEQFTVTANTGYAVRIDSIYATSAFYNTSSNTKLAVVYSLTGFVSDSVDVFTMPGGFVNPIVLTNQTGGPTNMYGLSVAGPAGIILQSGQTLSFRFYFSCGSSSPGRYAMLKDVKVIGNAASAGAFPLITTNGTLNNFSQIIGTASQVQTYTVSGADLTGNITITPPANYEVSADGGTTWFSNTTALVLTNAGGTIVNTIISVRLNATALGNYSGSIIHESNGAANRTLAVTGETKPLPVPAFSITAALSSFSQVAGTPSVAQTYKISGNDLTGDVSITPPVSYEVSANGGATWFANTSPLTISAVNGTIPNTTISVRLNAVAAGAYSGDIMHTSNGVATQNVAVSGTTVNPPLITSMGTLTAFTQTIGAPSASQTYTIGGANLSAANITIAAPAGYEISADGGATWFTAAAPLVLPATSGTINNTTITIRLNASTTGNYNGNIVHTSSGAATVNVAITGATVAAPVITMNSSLNEFLQTAGASSAEQNFTVQGSNLAGAMSLTAPAGYELAQGNSGWINSGDALIITPAAGNVNATVRVRLNATTAGQHNGTINIQSNGAVDATISLSGYTYPSIQIAPNPAADVVNIYHPAYYTVAFVTIYNMHGVKLGTWSTEPLSNKTTINIQKLTAGMYLAEYRRLNERTLIPFVKQ